jgi:DNA primase
MNNFVSQIFDYAMAEGLLIKQTSRSIILKCPNCGSKKLHLEKNEGYFKCYSASCGFRGGSIKLYAAIKGISFEMAKKELTGKDAHQKDKIIKFNFGLKETESSGFEFELEIPETFIPISRPEAKDGADYCQKRGISLDLATKLGLFYCTKQRRIVFFIRDSYGAIAGWQARSIDPVDHADRMRNNIGFRRDKHLMFYDKLEDKDFIIVCEGPFDAMKFNKLGNFVATMGKDISTTQLNMIVDHPCTKVYWALDDDARDLVLKKYAKYVGKESYIIEPQPAAKDRILKNKPDAKVDFGECTEDECVQSFLNPEKINTRLVLEF